MTETEQRRSWAATDDVAWLLQAIHTDPEHPGSLPSQLRKAAGYSQRRMRLFAAACLRPLRNRLDATYRHFLDEADGARNQYVGRAFMQKVKDMLQHRRLHRGSLSLAVTLAASHGINFGKLAEIMYAASSGGEHRQLADAFREVFGPTRDLPTWFNKEVVGRGDDKAELEERGWFEVTESATEATTKVTTWGLYGRPSFITPVVLEIARNAYEEVQTPPCPACEGGRKEGCNACLGTGLDDPRHLKTDLLGILADALEDAGCNEQVVLRHLRGETPCPVNYGRGWHEMKRAGWRCEECGGKEWVEKPHPCVRGCWALDGVLGNVV